MNDSNRWLEIGKAIERAAMDLPEGYELIASIEREAGSVSLFDPDGNEYDHFGEASESFGEEIDEAIDYAMEHSKWSNHG